jgi:predicted PurR-regulated permease PerM
MNEPLRASKEIQFLYVAAALVVVVAGMKTANALVVQLLVAVFLAALCLPTFNWLLRKRVPAAASLFIVISAMLIIGVFVVAVIGTSVNDFAHEFPIYQVKFLALQQDVFDWLKEKGIDTDEIVNEDVFDTRRALGAFTAMLGSFSTLMGDAFVIFLIFVFVLLEAAVFEDKLGAIGSGSSRARFDRIQDDIRRYIAIKTVVSLMTGVLVAVWLSILGVPYPVMFGMLAFLFNFVPNIGSIIAAVPAVVLAMLQLGIGPACYAAAGYLVVNVVIGNVIEPRVMGKSLGLSTLVVFLSLIFWGWVLGPIGMILSVPLTMIVKIVLENSSDLRWVAILLDSKAPTESGARS